MADIKCTKCGGTLKFQQGDTVGVCESCGAEQTLAHLDETEEKCIAPAKPTKILNKQIVIRTLIVCACVALVILGIIYRISLGIKINDRHFPDRALSNSVRILDLNQNGYLSKKELAEADTLGIWGPCRDLSGIEYLTNLKSLGINGCQFSDLSGVEYLTNLEELHLSNIYGQCPDLSALENLTNLKELRIYESVFSEKFVFDNDISVTNLNFKYCVFEKGILFKNNSVEDVNVDECAACGEVVFADCDGLMDFDADFHPDDYDLDWVLDDYKFDYFEALMEQSFSIDLSGCDSLERVFVHNTGIISSVNLSNCSMLREIILSDWRDKSDEITLNISGCPNIDYAHIGLNGLKELDISDCPLLISVTEQTPSDKDYCLEYESEDGYIWASNEKLKIIR